MRRSMLTRRNFIVLASGFCAFFPFMAQAGAGGEATRLFNTIRAEHGLPAMQPDARLEAMARHQASLMAGKGKVSHSVGWGNGFAARLQKFGIRGAAGENLCAGQKDAAAAYQAWMNSAGHRRNMLDPEFSRYGLAFAVSEERPGYKYWAMVLGR